MSRFLPLRAATSLWPLSTAFSWHQGGAQDEQPRFDRQRTAAPQNKPTDQDNAKNGLADFHFTFGPRNTYYYAGLKGAHWTLPMAHTHHPFIEDPDTTVKWIAWNNEDFCAKFTKSDESSRITNGAIQTNLPQICSWLDAYRADDPHVVLGQNQTFILWCKDSGRWLYSIDKSASKEIESRLNEDRVSLVALGCSSAYYIKYQDGSAAWDLKGQYPSLAIALDAIEHSEGLEVQYLAIDAFNSHHYFLLLNNKSVAFHLDSSTRDRIKRIIERDGLTIRGENY